MIGTRNLSMIPLRQSGCKGLILEFDFAVLRYWNGRYPACGRTPRPNGRSETLGRSGGVRWENETIEEGTDCCSMGAKGRLKGTEPDWTKGDGARLSLDTDSKGIRSVVPTSLAGAIHATLLIHRSFDGWIRAPSPLTSFDVLRTEKGSVPFAPFFPVSFKSMINDLSRD